MVGYTRKKILIVDDNELDRMILSEILEEKYEVLEAENGQEALNILKERREEIGGIILDLIMPVMDGYTFLERFSAMESCRNLPVLVATADEEPDMEKRCLKLGVWDFVRRPYDPVMVCMRIQNSMERKRLYMLEKQRIMDTLHRYMDPSIIQEVLSNDEYALSLSGKTMEIVVLFVDIRGFTALSERIEPVELVKILNEYLTLTSHCIKKNEGTLDKFIGDCTMALWGAPLTCEDSAYKACRAAMDMAEASKPLADRLTRQYGQELSYGIGIHMGPAVVGNIGTPERMDYTAIGDTVNTASRLEENAPAGTIYISRTVADALGSRAKTTSLGCNIKLKGKTEEFEILTLDVLE